MGASHLAFTAPRATGHLLLRCSGAASKTTRERKRGGGGRRGRDREEDKEGERGQGRERERSGWKREKEGWIERCREGRGEREGWCWARDRS